MRPYQLSFLLLASLTVTASCSMVLVNTIPTKVGGALTPGSTRDELIARIGAPISTGSFPISSDATVYREHPVPASSDLYYVTGLVQVTTDPYGTQWNVYPAFVIISLGLLELVVFPFVVVDLPLRGLLKYELRTWYDSSGGLVAYRKTLRPGLSCLP